MAESTKNFTIERLNNENYNTWSFEAEMLLRREDLWHCIDENALPLDVKWKKADGKALATIVLVCERRGLLSRIIMRKCRHRRQPQQ